MVPSMDTLSMDIHEETKKVNLNLNLLTYAPKIPHPTCTPCLKTSSKCITDLNEDADEKIGENLQGLGLSKEVLELAAKVLRKN